MHSLHQLPAGVPPWKPTTELEFVFTSSCGETTQCVWGRRCDGELAARGRRDQSQDNQTEESLFSKACLRRTPQASFAQRYLISVPEKCFESGILCATFGRGQNCTELRFLSEMKKILFFILPWFSLRFQSPNHGSRYESRRMTCGMMMASKSREKCKHEHQSSETGG